MRFSRPLSKSYKGVPGSTLIFGRDGTPYKIVMDGSQFLSAEGKVFRSFQTSSSLPAWRGCFAANYTVQKINTTGRRACCSSCQWFQRMRLICVKFSALTLNFFNLSTPSHSSKKNNSLVTFQIADFTHQLNCTLRQQTGYKASPLYLSYTYLLRFIFIYHITLLEKLSLSCSCSRKDWTRIQCQIECQKALWEKTKKQIITNKLTN